jgi:Ca-activated chloride channel family protein
LHNALTGPDSAAALAANDLRGPTGQPSATEGHDTAPLPAQHGKSLATLSQHHVWHVLTTWHPDQRRANILVVVDVSASQGNTAPGSNVPLFQVVQQGVTQLATLLPPTSHLGLWKFGYQLSPPNDYQVLAPTAALDPGQQQRFATATEQLTAQTTGTALYDTILAAYKDQQAHFRHGMPNEVLIFTDGKNEDAPDSISIDQLKANLAATDPTKRVQIGVLAFRGPAFRGPAPVDQLTDALSSVGGQVDTLNNANDVLGAFVHAVSGGLTHT